ncbi:MAG: hypothetical protein ACR2KE_03160 [Candidatus Nanopelagicales bacterium]
MAERLLLHIGTQKSGTTYLQRVLARLSGELKREGVLYPLRLHGRREVYNHEAAAYGLLGTSAFPWVPAKKATGQQASWEGLRRKVRDWDGTAIVSGEAISVINASDARRLVESLGVADTRVIITARDLGRVLPSSWQQHIRNGRSTPFGRFLQQHAERRGEGDAAERAARWDADPEQTFWRAYAIGTLVERWAPLARTVSVVTVPRRGAGPDELWHRFRRSLDVGAALPETPPAIDDLEANVGLTEPEVMVLAGLNKQIDSAKADGADPRALRARIVREAFVTREHRGSPVRIPRDWRERVSEWAREDAEVLQSTAAILVGPESDLLVDPASPVGDGPDAYEVSRAAGAALALLAGVSAR